MHSYKALLAVACKKPFTIGRSRLQAERQSVVESATEIIEPIAERRIAAYEGRQQVSGLFQRNAGPELPELKAFVQINGVHPNSTLSGSKELRDAIRQNAVRFLTSCCPRYICSIIA